MKPKFLTMLLVVLASVLFAAAALTQQRGDWKTLDIRGIHYAVERNSLEPDRWRAELQHTADCMAPCVVAFDDRLSAVHLRYKWMQLNPADGVYDFSDLAAVLDVIHAAGKKATLIVMAGKYTPPWVFEKGAAHLETRFKGNDRFAQPYVPVPWDPVFLKAHGDMIDALSAHLRQTPARYDTVVVVKNGGVTTHSGETRLMPPKAFLNRGQMRKAGKVEEFLADLCADYARAGYREDRVLAAAARMTRQIATAFPDKYLGLAFVTGARRFPTVNASGKCTYGKSNKTLNMMIKEGVTTYGRRMIMGNTVLTRDMGQPPIMAWVTRNGGQIAFQLNREKVGCRSGSDNPCDRDPLRQALRAGIDAGAVFIEVHEGNIQRHRDILQDVNRDMTRH